MSIRRISLRYELAWWSMVFPVGMYVACTANYAETPGLEFLAPVARTLIYVAWICWAAVAAGLLGALLRSTASRP